jgi:type IV pilus assembly protein PilQ
MRNNIPSTYAVNLPARGFTLNPSLLTDVMGLGMQFGLLAPQYLTELDMRIQMGEGTGQAKTIAKPKVQVLDREKASILRGTEIPYLSTSQQQGTQVQFKNAVLQLEVTPTIYSSGRIGMKLNVKDDFPDPTLTVAGNPAIGKREAETNMEVNDGETAVIGGILRDRALQNREGWPGLMNIPLIGYLFSSKVKEKTLDELLIFITPTIVKRPPKAS